jgi:hypothetical protein
MVLFKIICGSTCVIQYYEEWPIGQHRSAYTWTVELGSLEFWFSVWVLPLIYCLALDKAFALNFPICKLWIIISLWESCELQWLHFKILWKAARRQCFRVQGQFRVLQYSFIFINTDLKDLHKCSPCTTSSPSPRVLLEMQILCLCQT